MGNASSKEEVTLKTEIGRGTYAVVYRAVWRNTKVAAKKIHPEILSKPDAKKYTEEWKILSELDHPNIVKYLTVVLPETPPKSPDESIIIITELLDQDLKTFIKRSIGSKSNTESKAKPKVCFHDTVSIMLDVAEGLKYLHELPRPIVHRDLACKNILLTTKKQAKIADFGFAKCFPGGQMAATANPGTPANRAPEAFGKYFFSRGPITYGTKADVFSFGVVLLEVIVGHPSVQISELRTEDGEIIPEHYRRSKDLDEIHLDHPLRELVYSCLEDDPKVRPTALDLVNELSEYKANNEFQRSQDSLHCKQVIHRMPDDKYDYEFKIVLVGDTAVGKTSIAKRFVQPDFKFQEKRPMTINIGEYNERLQLKGKSVLLQIVDTSGQFNVTSSLPQFYRGAHGAAVVFDVASWDSLVSVRQWVSLVRAKCGNQIPIILVANKTDCERREVNFDTADNVRDEFNLFYIEVSAKTGKNIDEIFSVLTEQLMQQRDLGIAAGPSGACVTDHQLPSTSSRCNQPPAKITAKEPTKRKRIAKDPDSVSLIAVNEDYVSRVPAATTYGSINTSSAKETSRAKKTFCCF